MEITELHEIQNKEELQLLSKETVLIVLFTSIWDTPGKKMENELQVVKNNYENKAKVCKVDIDINQDLAIENGVVSLPTTIIFSKEKIEHFLPGVVQENKVSVLVEGLL